jgi:DNA repair protein RecO (recombination protein O)
MPVGETDRRVVLLTKERGKISAFARGARKQTSPLLAKCQPFATGEFTVYPGRDSYTVVQAEITEYFKEIQTDLDAVCYGCYFCEFAGYFARENLEAGELVNLLYLTLSMLVKKRFSYAFLRRIFELRVLGLEGEAPWVSDCLLCHDKEHISWFFYSRGGVLCESCAKKLGKQAQGVDAVRVEESVRYTMAYVLMSPLEKMYGFQVTEEVGEKVAKFVEGYVNRMVRHEFKSLGMIL